jgi:hypothetical protein
MAGHTKDELIAEIENARLRLRQSLGGLRRQADVNSRMKNSFTQNTTVWLGGAGIAGWILSRLPARKKKVKVYVDKKDGGQIKQMAEAGLLVWLLKFLFALLKPAIAAFASQKIADLAAGNHQWKK